MDKPRPAADNSTKTDPAAFTPLVILENPASRPQKAWTTYGVPDHLAVHGGCTGYSADGRQFPIVVDGNECHILGELQPFERVTVRANLFPPRRPQIDPLVTAVSDEDSDSQVGIPLIVTRAKSEASARPLRIGQNVAIGVTSLRVLPNYTMAVERASHVVEIDR